MRRSLIGAACAALLFVPGAARAGRGDITLVGHVPIAGSSFITDVCGYYDAATGKEYAITGDDVLGRIYIIDVTNPPTAGLKNIVSNVAAFDMKVWGNYLYTVDGDQAGTDGNIIDISVPTAAAKLPNLIPSAHNIAISETGIMYMENPGLKVYDLNANPLAPALLSSRGRAGHDATVHGNLVYDFHADVTNIWNMADPANPVLLGSIDYGGVTYHHSGDVTTDGRYLFICDELSLEPMPDFHVFDIQNPAAAVHVADYTDPGASIHNFYIVDDIAYVSYYSAGFRTFDVSDPTAPVMLDEFDTSGTSGNGFMGAFGVYPWLPSGRVLVSDWDNGVYIFEVDRGTTPVAITPFEARDGAVLEQNHPNPFNPTTTISWRLAGAGPMSLRVFDARGRLVRTLVEGHGEAGPGSVRWDGRDRRGRAVASGVYFYRLTAGSQSFTRRMTLVK